jgi:hypothetical protein
MTMKKIILTSAMVCIMLLIADCFAVTIPPDSNYVIHVAQVINGGATGNDANSGHSFQEAKLTIAGAVADANSGDTIVIWPGTFTENVVGTGKGLHYIGIDNQYSKIIAADPNVVALIPDLNSTVENLYIECMGGSTTTTAVAVKSGNTTKNLKIQNCIIKGASFGAWILSVNTDLVFLDNKVVGRGSAMRIQSGKAEVRRCFFESTGNFLATQVSAVALSIDNSTSTRGGFVIDNCILSSTTALADINVVGFQTGFTDNGASFVFSNNTITGRTTGSFNQFIYGIRNASGLNGHTLVENCSFATTNSSASGTVYDIYNDRGQLNVINCSYSPTKVLGTITKGGSESQYITMTRTK